MQKIAWHIEQRGCDILDLPDEVRFDYDQPHLPVVVQESLKAGDFNIAATVIGYRNAAEKTRLASAIETLRTQYSKQRIVENSAQVIQAARDAVETVIGFWKRPSTYDRSDTDTSRMPGSLGSQSENDLNFGPNVGYDLGPDSYGFGANINAETSAYMQAQKMFDMEMKSARWRDESLAPVTRALSNSASQNSPIPSTISRPLARPRLPKQDWESYHDLCRDVAILHGARNKHAVRLAPVDSEGYKDDLTAENVGENISGGSAESFGDNYNLFLAAQLQRSRQIQTTEQEFAWKMNDKFGH